MYPYGLNVIWNNRNLIKAVKQNDKESIYNSRNNSNKRKRVGKGGRKKRENRDIDTVKKEVRTPSQRFSDVFLRDCLPYMFQLKSWDITEDIRASARRHAAERRDVCQRILLFKSVPRSHCQVIYSQFGLAIHQNDHQARRRFVEWAQHEIAVVPDFHKRILFSDEAHFWLNGYVNKQNCRIWSEANPQVYVETPLHPEKLTVWCALWAGGILLQKR
ncbi:hypothetical protein TNCV_3964381 [Trichonephila clavipes]|nr:hypothetical protein TNCV_3964381 [Trichonephila clavipes]